MRLLLTVLVCLLAWPALSAPPPDPMLATPYHGNVAVADFLVSEKLDGVRAWPRRELTAAPRRTHPGGPQRPREDAHEEFRRVDK